VKVGEDWTGGITELSGRLSVVLASMSGWQSPATWCE
jgi:hypothetical protein